jgi:hypothetical protein
MKVRAGSVAKDGEVDNWVRVKEGDLKHFTMLLDRLEREHRARIAAAAGVPLVGVEASVTAGDGYDPREDAVTPKLLKMMEDWLAGVREKVEGVCPCCGQRVGVANDEGSARIGEGVTGSAAVAPVAHG